MSLHGQTPGRLRRRASDMNGVDKEAIVSVRQRPFTNPAMSSWAPRSRLPLRMLTAPLRAYSVRIGEKVSSPWRADPPPSGAGDYALFAFCQKRSRNQRQVSTAVWHRRRGGLPRPVCAGPFSPAKQRCFLRSESAFGQACVRDSHQFRLEPV